MSWRPTWFYIVTFVYWNIVYIESCMYKSVLGKINKLQKKTFRTKHGMGSILKGDWVSDCCLATQQFFSYIMERLVNFHWGDKEVHFVLTNTLSCIFYIASSLKQQFAKRHVALLGHILIPSQPIFPLSPQCCLLIREAKKKHFHILWFHPIVARTHDLPHSNRAR